METGELGGKQWGQNNEGKVAVHADSSEDKDRGQIKVNRIVQLLYCISEINFSASSLLEIILIEESFILVRDFRVCLLSWQEKHNIAFHCGQKEIAVTEEGTWERNGIERPASHPSVVFFKRPHILLTTALV